jgi:UDP-N-acetylmuramate dehydrogenase
MKFRGELKENVSLSTYTTWYIGGPARYFYRPLDLEDLANFLKYFPEVIGDQEVIFLGAGSNVLIRDGGIAGVVICLRGCLNQLELLPSGEIKAEAGATLANLINFCFNLDLVDCVFLAGIPGTVGGALLMNAGAHGYSFWDHVISVETINKDGIIEKHLAKDFKASYRFVEGLKQNEWFVSATLKFAKGDVILAKKKMHDFLQKRKDSQPLSEHNCGSVFKNPPNDFAARLIEDCGFKGKQIGGAKVSEKHANFIVNIGNATSRDVETLMQEIVTTVEKKHGVKLIPEIKILGVDA